MAEKLSVTLQTTDNTVIRLARSGASAWLSIGHSYGLDLFFHTAEMADAMAEVATQVAALMRASDDPDHADSA